jgi:hypothetical protein
MVVPTEQYAEYRQTIPLDIMILPCDVLGSAPTRQFMLHLRPTGKLIMIDDDLTFYQRSEDGTKFSQVSKSTTEQMIAEIVDFLDRYCMVGLTDKFMSQTRPRGFVECSRFNEITGCNRDLLPNPWPEYRIPNEEEHDFHLQVLTQGYKTAVLTEWSKSGITWGSGGCSEWRTVEVFKKAHDRLLELWPELVKVSPDKRFGTKASFQWKKARMIGERIHSA